MRQFCWMRKKRWRRHWRAVSLCEKSRSERHSNIWSQLLCRRWSCPWLWTASSFSGRRCAATSGPWGMPSSPWAPSRSPGPPSRASGRSSNNWQTSSRQRCSTNGRKTVQVDLNPFPANVQVKKSVFTISVVFHPLDPVGRAFSVELSQRYANLILVDAQEKREQIQQLKEELSGKNTFFSPIFVAGRS